MIRTKAPIENLARRVFSHGFRRFGRVFFFIFCRVHIIHIGRLPQDRAMILASNHISHFDPLLLGTFFARYVDWMAMEELFSHPLAASILVHRLLNPFGFAAGQLAVFQGASEAPISESIRAKRATRKNSQPAAAQRVALKMGRRLRCSSVTYRFRYAPSSRLAGGPF
jgi:hypothetical protein